MRFQDTLSTKLRAMDQVYLADCVHELILESQVNHTIVNLLLNIAN